MKNFSPLKRSLALAMLLCVIALSIGGFGTAIFAEPETTSSASEQTVQPVTEAGAESQTDKAASDSSGTAETTDAAPDSGDGEAAETKTTTTPATGAETKADGADKGDGTEKETGNSDTADDTAETTADLKAQAEAYNVNTSFWDTIAVPFGYIIKGCSWLTGGSYPLALLLFAIAMKVVLFPFGIKQQKNSVKQARLRPKEQAIREKYAGRTDKPTQQKMQQEIMDLYQRENFNPMGGCLPLLLQFPILFALFRVVYNPLRHVMGLATEEVTRLGRILIENGLAKPGELVYDINIINKLKEMGDDKFHSLCFGVSDKLTSISDMPRISIFGLDLTQTPTVAQGVARWLWLIPVVTFIAVFVSMKLTKKFTYQPTAGAAGDAAKSGKIMDFIMPLISTAFAAMYPAVLGLYWIYQNLLGVVQQIVLAKMFPLPVFSEEDFAAARKEILGKSPKKKPSSARRNPKSLHHIDDDDDEFPADGGDDEADEAPHAALLNGEKLPEQKGAVPPAALKDSIPAPEGKKKKKKDD